MKTERGSLVMKKESGLGKAGTKDSVYSGSDIFCYVAVCKQGKCIPYKHTLYRTS